MTLTSRAVISPFTDETEWTQRGTCSRDRASPKQPSPISAFNRRTLHRKSPKIPMSSPKLANPRQVG